MTIIQNPGSTKDRGAIQKLDALGSECNLGVKFFGITRIGLLGNALFIIT